jgi:tetratricopeptide (TPR) repeat protein
MDWPDDQQETRSLVARELFYQAYRRQMSGQLEDAVLLYRQSIETLPTAEALTFLGWTYRFQGKVEEAIEECKNAILVDPTLGNPYNDIGAYLIDLGRHEEAIPWLEKATRSKRYASYHYPWFNLGRAFEAMGCMAKAAWSYQKSREIAPEFQPATEALERLASFTEQQTAGGVH